MHHAEEIRRKAIEMNAEDAGGIGTPARVAAKEFPPKLFNDIPKMFQPFTQIPRPEDFDPMVNAVGSALEKLSTGAVADDPIRHVSYPANINLSKVPGVTGAIEDWTGEAARNFKRSFLDTFPSISKNQFLVARILGAALDSEKELWKRTQDNIDQIAHKALEALDKMHDCGKNEWNIALTVAGALAALLGVVATGGADLPYAIIEFGATAPNAVIQYSGETAVSVIKSMHQGILDLTRKINETEYQIWRAVDKTHAAIQQNRNQYVANRPDLTYANPRNIKDPRYMGFTS